MYENEIRARLYNSTTTTMETHTVVPRISCPSGQGPRALLSVPASSSALGTGQVFTC